MAGNYTATDKVAFTLLGGGAVTAALYIVFGWGPLGFFLGHPATAAWAQAIGAVVAIYFAGRFAAKQLAHTEDMHARMLAESDRAALWACLHVTREANNALFDLWRKFSGQIDRSPKRSMERIAGLEASFQSLLRSRLPAEAIPSILVVLRELNYSSAAIRVGRAPYDQERINSSWHRAHTVLFELETLKDLYLRHAPQDHELIAKFKASRWEDMPPMPAMPTTPWR